ncbi:MAG TPA: hypothetical protein VKE98_22460 [Gemmataceae bacterium]|nr:hypothetical protein [Gemmataceae bacterium]
MKSKWRRYEVLLPHRFNDGRPVPNAWLAEAVNEIVDQFRAVSFEKMKVEGRWRRRKALSGRVSQVCRCSRHFAKSPMDEKVQSQVEEKSQANRNLDDQLSH